MFERIVQPTNAKTASFPRTYPGRRIGTPPGLGIGVKPPRMYRCPVCGLRGCKGHVGHRKHKGY